MNKIFFISAIGFAVMAIGLSFHRDSDTPPQPSVSALSTAHESITEVAPLKPIVEAPNEAVRAESPPQANLNTEESIQALNREIEDHERFLYKENAIRRLNDGTASAEQRDLYFDVMEKLARARAKKVELRIQRLQVQIEHAQAGQ